MYTLVAKLASGNLAMNRQHQDSVLLVVSDPPTNRSSRTVTSWSSLNTDLSAPGRTCSDRCASIRSRWKPSSKESCQLRIRTSGNFASCVSESLTVIPCDPG